MDRLKREAVKFPTLKTEGWGTQSDEVLLSRLSFLVYEGREEWYTKAISASEARIVKTPPKALKKAKKSAKVKLLASSKSIVNVVTVNDISPV